MQSPSRNAERFDDVGMMFVTRLLAVAPTAQRFKSESKSPCQRSILSSNSFHIFKRTST